MSGTPKKVLLYIETHNATSHPLEERDKEKKNEKKESTGKERRKRDQKKEENLDIFVVEFSKQNRRNDYLRGYPMVFARLSRRVSALVRASPLWNPRFWLLLTYG